MVSGVTSSLVDREVFERAWPLISYVGGPSVEDEKDLYASRHPNPLKDRDFLASGRALLTGRKFADAAGAFIRAAQDAWEFGNPMRIKEAAYEASLLYCYNLKIPCLAAGAHHLMAAAQVLLGDLGGAMSSLEDAGQDYLLAQNLKAVEGVITGMRVLLRAMEDRRATNPRQLTNSCLGIAVLLDHLAVERVKSSKESDPKGLENNVVASSLRLAARQWERYLDMLGKQGLSDVASCTSIRIAELTKMADALSPVMAGQQRAEQSCTPVMIAFDAGADLPADRATGEFESVNVPEEVLPLEEPLLEAICPPAGGERLALAL